MDRVFTLENIHQVAEEFIQWLGDRKIVAVHGSMGAGKTSFIHAIADIKGVKDAVSSPTFSIINEYLYRENNEEKKMFHIDLYRLKDEKEALNAGVEECVYSEELCFIEWPERAPGLFPSATIHIYIDVMDELNRRLRIGNN